MVEYPGYKQDNLFVMQNINSTSKMYMFRNQFVNKYDHTNINAYQKQKYSLLGCN